MAFINIVSSSWRSEKYLEGFFLNLLGQTCQDFRVILVLNGATEEEERIVARYDTCLDMKLLRVPRELVSLSLNRGLKEVEGEGVVIFNVDDRLKEYALEEIMSAFMRHNEADILYFDYEVQKPDKGIVLKPSSLFDFELLKRINYLPPCLVFRERVLQKEEVWFSSDYELACDYEFNLRLASKGYHFFYIEKVMLTYMFSKHSKTSTQKAKVKECVAHVREAYRACLSPGVNIR